MRRTTAQLLPGCRSALLSACVACAICGVGCTSAASSAIASCRGTGGAGYADCSRRSQEVVIELRTEADHPFPRIYTDKSAAADCHDLTSFERVVDLSCLYQWSRAAFHRLADCVVPNLELYELAGGAANKANTVLVVPEPQRVFVDVLLPLAHRLAATRFLHPDRDNNQSCLLVAATAVVTYETRTLGTREVQRARAARFRAAILRGIPSLTKPRNSLLFIDRRHGEVAREMDNAAEIRAFLKQQLPNYPQETYFGNESLVHTAELFAHARIVVGFHGAGHTNTIFCRNETVVVELTWFMDERMDKLWRTNDKLAEMHGALHWIVYALRLSESIPSWHEINKKDKSTPVADLFQAMKLVHVPLADAVNVVNLIKAALPLPT